VDIGATAAKDHASGDRGDQDCRCPGLCSTSVGIGLDVAANLKTAPWPQRQGPIGIVASLGSLRLRSAGGASLARAPPQSSREAPA
jgi:hypothetical protein